ncbi:23S rRNA (adenine(2030)-N(6))-methyltransferase RlmJ [Gluconacetobacter entanii]|uniref:Ribosomal RNA large subunit methyltransferase J n=1 Tax=Gluconacetobacter entanii TaxID=108528 RepID=A0ABT3K737_9PROT|nr:23S rRNA (adenine(2030)-N(6))-methyltransferase RlmJ [Gluconacetobacter entanii]MCW4591206.1 23S rRNA (adenine(2030)-N(6))-methyltransferase RlmJ [Gluconacetobacter entanii]MCW4595448.1 23S rRNA (adenine(2030)-N(6))-methyltransferase RlmJ [Gluconacetobacter entanii]NPC88530.1 23S rRNA (adenine(2030)-N(6))-methyltransferase RlmJ [Gluconacetobacter entanii]
MNYRHSYHAGNFADVMKHVVLMALIGALRRKPSPFCVLDTHAGIGLYDLSGAQAQSTGEWREGIGRLLDAPQGSHHAPDVENWLEVIRAVMRDEQAGRLSYPGSPALVARLLRPGDSLICCELHPEDQQALRHLFRHDRNVSVHGRDGYQAITALLPPKQARRGLVFMDPPFERPDEFQRLGTAIMTARQRFPAGIVAGWYPIKHRAPVRAFINGLKDAGQRKLLTLELTLRPPLDPSRLNGSGIIIANPPFRFEEEARGILASLCRYLGDGEADFHVEWAVPE